MKQDLVVIGGGPGGLVVASVAAQLGLRVTLVEQSERLGGDCLHSGCVPSKSLIAMARLAHGVRQGVASGLFPAMPEINFGRAMEHVDSVIARIQLHDDPERFRSYGCDVRFGKAAFIDEHAVVVDEEIIRARRFLIATGSQPAIPPITGLDEAGYDTNETLFRRHDLPPRLAIVGGGPIGVEMAQAFARLGSRVTVVEMADQLLGRMDPHAAAVLRETFEREGIRLHLGAGITAARRAGDSRTDIIAPYLVDQIRFSDRWQVLAGLRFDVIDFEATGHAVVELADLLLGERVGERQHRRAMPHLLESLQRLASD
ncbi:MAG: FAD-dependent oxidoreductase, partial [Thiohalobacterales bacterium]|nr:FAD-dependent oxidoreductase [Thiohalobacterales bacterium]